MSTFGPTVNIACFSVRARASKDIIIKSVSKLLQCLCTGVYIHNCVDVSVLKPNTIRSDVSEVQTVCRNSPLNNGEDLGVPRVQGDDCSTQCLHCAVNTCAVVLGAGGIWGDTQAPL